MLFWGCGNEFLTRGPSPDRLLCDPSTRLSNRDQSALTPPPAKGAPERPLLGPALAAEHCLGRSFQYLSVTSRSHAEPPGSHRLPVGMGEPGGSLEPLLVAINKATEPVNAPGISPRQQGRRVAGFQQKILEESSNERTVRAHWTTPNGYTHTNLSTSTATYSSVRVQEQSTLQFFRSRACRVSAGACCMSCVCAFNAHCIRVPDTPSMAQCDQTPSPAAPGGVGRGGRRTAACDGWAGWGRSLQLSPVTS